MIITHNQPAPGTTKAHHSTAASVTELNPSQSSIKTLILPPSLQMQQPIAVHHPRAGLNPMVDAASYLFAIMGQLKTTKHFHHLDKLHKELVDEINTFQQAVEKHHYNGEYIQVCRYVVCAALDELINSTAWGKDQWEPFSLLAAFNQDRHHREKFYTIMEHAIKEPAYYIDLMEFMYICLSLGYTGEAENSEQDQMQLDQITSSLYKYIRAYRGNISKSLSPAPIHAPRSTVNDSRHPSASHWNVLLLTACIIMTLFIGLGYLMEMISNEAINKFTDVQKSVTRHHLQ